MTSFRHFKNSFELKKIYNKKSCSTMNLTVNNYLAFSDKCILHAACCTIQPPMCSFPHLRFRRRDTITSIVCRDDVMGGGGKFDQTNPFGVTIAKLLCCHGTVKINKYKTPTAASVALSVYFC